MAVSSKLSEAVLLGIDLGLLEYLLKLEKQQRGQGVAINALTRAQTQKLQDAIKQDEEADAKDQASPIPVELEMVATDSEEGVSSEEVVMDENIK